MCDSYHQWCTFRRGRGLNELSSNSPLQFTLTSQDYSYASLQFFSVALAHFSKQSQHSLNCECKCHNCLLELQNFIACMQNIELTLLTQKISFMLQNPVIMSVIWPRPPKYKVFFVIVWATLVKMFSCFFHHDSQPWKLRFYKRNLIFVEKSQ